MAPAKPRYRTQIEDDPPSAPPSEARGLPWGVRAALAAVLLLAVVAAGRFMLAGVRAELQGKRGWDIAVQEAGSILGMQDLRSALRSAPWHPVLQQWVGVRLIAGENTNLLEGDYGSLDVRNFDEALNLLAEAARNHTRPGQAILKAGETANMLATMQQKAGNRTEFERLVRLTAERYMDYRRLHGRPFSDEALFYRIAMTRAREAGRPHEALNLYDDYRRFFQPTLPPTRESSVILGVVQRAREAMGEVTLLAGDLAERALRDPKSPEVLLSLDAAARRFRLHEPTRRILEEVDRRGQLLPEARPLLDALRSPPKG